MYVVFWLFFCLSKSCCFFFFFFSSRRRHTRLQGDWSSDVCSSDLFANAFQITTGDLTLDAQGDPNAVWVFQCNTTGPTVGDTTAPRNVMLINGAQAKNVYWASNGAATINAIGGGTMVGTIITATGLSIGSATSTAATNLNGRAVVTQSPLIMH